MSQKIHISGATYINKGHALHNRMVSITIVDGKISQIHEGIAPAPDGFQEIGFEQLMVTPGWVDMRTVSTDPGFEYKDDLSSLRASAAAGGFTKVCLLPNTSPCTQTKESIAYILRHNDLSPTALLPFAAASENCKGEAMTELLDLADSGAIGFTDGLRSCHNLELIKNILIYLQPHDGLYVSYPNDESLSQHGQMHEGEISTSLGFKGVPSLAEVIALQRELALVEYTSGKIHFSGISTTEGVELIRQAKAKGLRVTADTPVANLIFTDDALNTFDTHFKVSPPLRGEKDKAALWGGLKDGTIDAIVSNHYPHDPECKNLEFDLADNGMLSLESFWGSLLSNAQLPIETLVQKIAIEPRRILGIDLPSFAEGDAAELTLFTTESANFTLENIKSKSRNSPFIGQKLKGNVIGVINGNNSFIA